MITDQTYEQERASAERIFAEAGWAETPVPNELRIQKIEEKLIYERIAKETTDFVFTSFGVVLENFTHVFLGSRSEGDELSDYRV